MTRTLTLIAALVLAAFTPACGADDAPTPATATSPAPHTTAAQHHTARRLDALEDRLDALEARPDQPAAAAARPDAAPLMFDAPSDDDRATDDAPAPVKQRTPPKRLAAADDRDAPPSDRLPLAPSDLKLVDQTMATAVTDRAPQGRADAFHPSDKTLWAWVKVRNDADAPSRITMVWKRDGEVRSTVHLDVGVSEGWRTWSRKSIGRRDVGRWSVEITNPEGDRLGTLNFTVEPDPTSVLLDLEEPGC